MARTRRRSLLSKRTPVPTERLVRTPAVLKAVPAEDAPLAPRRVTQSNSPTLTPVSSQPPRDPALVEFDLADHELPELPMEAFDLIEELDDSELGVPIAELEPLDVPAPSAVSALLLPEFGPPPAQGAVVAPMALAFMGSGLATMFVVLLPWFAFVSPQLDASRQARIAAANVAPTVIEIPMPVPVPVPVLVEPVVEVEPEPEPEVMKAKPVARPRRPRPTPVAAVDPVPKARPKPRAKPAPAPVAASVVPDAARVLAGTLNGTADGKSMTMRLEFLPGGRLKARISRSGVSSRRASGSYTVSGKRATFALVESGSDAASYTGTVSPSGANGRVTFSDGSKGRLKVRR